MTQTVAVALSGGIDSLVSAYLLKQKGVNVIGFHFITGYETQQDSPQLVSENIETLCKRFDIPLYVVNIHRVFKETVIQYFTESYANALTPNPCIVCNAKIKFGLLLNIVMEHGADFFATGHYAQNTIQPDGRCQLRKGMDFKKDQSYFLSQLTQSQLKYVLFPLGKLTKAQVRKIAEENCIKPVVSKESQDVCFIQDAHYTEIFGNNVKARMVYGPIIDTHGNRLGTHKGLYHYTIGQRRGLNCPASEPYYVKQKDMSQNALIVGKKNELFASSCMVKDVHWINDSPKSSIAVSTRIRYSHTEAPSELIFHSDNRVVVKFKTPQWAITPGQYAVFYDDQEVLGSGWIEENSQEGILRRWNSVDLVWS
ncbi:MAG: tRNA 2-thiouridine(34) synthase MnmA [Desulfobacterales bacterium]|nr:tRNA 2-thiouridine(34) synthase MnmA [Desulfobacterales bacterium]